MLTLIPLPARLEELPGSFQLTPETGILADAANHPNADFLSNLLSVPTGYGLPIRSASPPGAANNISLRLDPALTAFKDEGYRLEVRPDGVTLEAFTPSGVFYGLQTLRQLLPPEVETRTRAELAWSIPCVHIEDWPRFAWRGFMLDEGRYFHGKEAVLQTLDLLALQKLNVFHWHLTEDQGWRIEIQQYPRLTEIGSRRAGTRNGFCGKTHNHIPHAGFYTQADIREIVAYAAARHITVVPEIEMPGHSTAALAAYPEFSCTGGPFEVATHFGIYPDIYCAGKEATFTFLQNVLDEVLDLFPSPYIHIGGDEAPKARWKNCPDCQRRIQAQGLAGEHALQVYFTNRIGVYLARRGRRLMGWNEILEPSLAKDALVQYWRGNQGALMEAIRQDKRQVIMSTFLDTYLDHGYSLMPLIRAYRYEPVPAALAESESASVLGLEAPLWSEWLPSRARLEYQAYPRTLALAETAWTPKTKKDLTGFRYRLVHFLPRLDRLGVRYAPLADVEPAPWEKWLGTFSLIWPQKKVA
jgi:hexosaminidase